MIHQNNSHILITEVGQTDISASPPTNNGLQCITDRIPCCTTSRFGAWHFPNNGGIVPSQNSRATTFYRNKGNDGTVNLNRVSDDITSPTGQFCCVILDAVSYLQRICANIGDQVLNLPEFALYSNNSLYTACVLH